MSEYKPESFIYDYVQRTKRNLDIIEQKEKTKSDDEKVYEVTQLINSLFGLLILPFEKYSAVFDRYLKSSPSFSNLKQICEDIMNSSEYYSNYPDNGTVNGFIRHIRNSLAHSGNNGILFYPINNGGKIESILFYDFNEEKYRTQKFCTQLNVHQLREFAHQVANVYCEYESLTNQNNQSKHNDENLTLAKFHERLDECQRLFQEYKTLKPYFKK